MRIAAPLVLAGTALFATGIAVAATHHVMRVPLSGGEVATIEYEGDVAPRVTIIPIARMTAAQAAAADPFAQMDAMFAAMAQRQQLMMRQIAALQAKAEAQAESGGPVQQAAIGEGAPAGGSYSFVSSTTTTSSGGCGHSVEIVQRAGSAPQRTERSFGDCGRANAAPAPRAPHPAAAPVPAVPTI